ncbi:MAG: lysylphosphatidylglycerol synthase transmembrane domain-containing protein [Pseudomonadota bacterium]
MSKLLINAIASILLITMVFWWVDGAAVLSHLRELSLGWITVAVVALTAATASMARRWQVVAGHLGLNLRYKLALREYYLGTLINQILPGGVTGDVARAFRARDRADLKTAALSVAMERLLGQVAVFAVLAVGLAWAFVIPGGIDWGPWAWLVPLGFLLLLAAALQLARRTHLTGRLTAMTLALQRRPELLLHAAFACGCFLLGLYACARATGTLVPAHAWFTVMPLILIAMLVPLSVGGLGWREGAAAALFPLMGEPSSAGVAAGLAYGAAILIAAMPAVFFLWKVEISRPFATSDPRG